VATQTVGNNPTPRARRISPEALSRRVRCLTFEQPFHAGFTGKHPNPFQQPDNPPATITLGMPAAHVGKSAWRDARWPSWFHGSIYSSGANGGQTGSPLKSVPKSHSRGL